VDRKKIESHFLTREVA